MTRSTKFTILHMFYFSFFFCFSFSFPLFVFLAPYTTGICENRSEDKREHQMFPFFFFRIPVIEKNTPQENDFSNTSTIFLMCITELHDFSKTDHAVVGAVETDTVDERWCAAMTLPSPFELCQLSW